MFYVVHFHADGGQMCVPGVRSFKSEGLANELAAILQSEPGHSCGKGSVRVERSEAAPHDRGAFDIGCSNKPRGGSHDYFNRLKEFCVLYGVAWWGDD